MTLQLSTSTRNARANAITTAVGNAGLLRIYSGAAPVDCATAASGSLLCQHTLGTPFAPAAGGGVLSPTIPSNANAGANGTAGYWRVYDSGGATCHLQGSCGTSGTDMIMNTTALTSGGPVQITSWTQTEGGA